MKEDNVKLEFKPTSTVRLEKEELPMCSNFRNIDNFINKILESKESMLNRSCYPESITVEVDSYYNQLIIFGYRPENEKEKNLRINKQKILKGKNKKKMVAEKEKRKKLFLKLKKEFENN
jgi:hypothetical protein